MRDRTYYGRIKAIPHVHVQLSTYIILHVEEKDWRGWQCHARHIMQPTVGMPRQDLRCMTRRRPLASCQIRRSSACASHVERLGIASKADAIAVDHMSTSRPLACLRRHMVSTADSSAFCQLHRRWHPQVQKVTLSVHVRWYEMPQNLSRTLNTQCRTYFTHLC